MGLIDRLRRAAAVDMPCAPLYRAVVAIAREPRWYTAGQVPDSVDGRFDMVVVVLACVLLRLEREPGHETTAVTLTERFVDDMDGSLREIGIGDLVIGKHVGRLVGALGGRLGCYRDALAPDAPAALLEEGLVRNLYRGMPPSPEALGWTVEAVRALQRQVDRQPLERLLAGDLGE